MYPQDSSTSSNPTSNPSRRSDGHPPATRMVTKLRLVPDGRISDALYEPLKALHEGTRNPFSLEMIVEAVNNERVRDTKDLALTFSELGADKKDIRDVLRTHKAFTKIRLVSAMLDGQFPHHNLRVGQKFQTLLRSWLLQKDQLPEGVDVDYLKQVAYSKQLLNELETLTKKSVETIKLLSSTAQILSAIADWSLEVKRHDKYGRHPNISGTIRDFESGHRMIRNYAVTTRKIMMPSDFRAQVSRSPSAYQVVRQLIEETVDDIAWYRFEWSPTRSRL